MGAPARDGIKEIDAYQPDLLILKSGKHTFLERMLFTYSDYKLIETAQCPILVIKSGRPYADARVIAAVDPMHAHDKPAELDRHIVGAAIAIATALKLPVHLFHACSQLPPGLPTDKPLREIPQAVYEDICGIWQAKTRARVSALAEARAFRQRESTSRSGIRAPCCRSSYRATKPICW